MRNVWSTDFTQLDDIELTAAWLDKREVPTIAVKRFHHGQLRAHWEFEYVGKNKWECIRGTVAHMREEPCGVDLSKTRTSDTSKIPHDIELKLREFILRTLRIKPMRKQRK
jgi:hypothetical protein